MCKLFFSLYQQKMSVPSQTDAIHRDIVIFMGIGSVSALLGMSSYFMSHEYQDFDRSGKSESIFQQRKKWALAVMALSAFFYVCGIVLMTLGISLYRDEREEIASSISGIIIQTRQQAQQSSVDEPAILSSIGAALIILGMAQCCRNFAKTEEWGVIGSSIFASGWLINSFAAACNNNSLSSLRGDRLAWSLTGSAAIVAGTFMFPWMLHHNYVSGLSWAIMSLGYIAFDISTSFVVTSPD